jgi:hypothetical protein
MTRIRTILAGLLAAIFCAATFAVPAAAATPTDHHKYSRYLAIGDSWNAKNTAYPTVLAKALGTKLSLPDCTGYRTQELRFLLEDAYEGDELMFQFGAVSPKKAAKSGPKLRKLIGKAKLMTIQVGAALRAIGVNLTLNSDTVRSGHALRASHENAHSPAATGVNISPERPVRRCSSPTGTPSATNSAVTIAASESE